MELLFEVCGLLRHTLNIEFGWPGWSVSFLPWGWAIKEWAVKTIKPGAVSWKLAFSCFPASPSPSFLCDYLPINCLQALWENWDLCFLPIYYFQINLVLFLQAFWYFKSILLEYVKQKLKPWLKNNVFATNFKLHLIPLLSGSRLHLSSPSGKEWWLWDQKKACGQDKSWSQLWMLSHFINTHLSSQWTFGLWSSNFLEG